MRDKVDTVNQSDLGAPDTVLETMHALMHLYRSLRHAALRDDPDAPTQMELRALSFFVRQPGSTLSDLVAASGRDKAQLARLIARLKDGGFLSAEADGADRRSVRLAATVRGMAVFDALQHQSAHLAEVAVRGLDAAQQQALSGLLQTVKANLEAEQGTGGRRCGSATDGPRRRRG